MCIWEKKIDYRDLGMKVYFNVFDELVVVDGLVFCGERIVVLWEFREMMVIIVYEGY